MARRADAPRRPCAGGGEERPSRRAKDIWPPETRCSEDFRLVLVREKKRKRAIKGLLALNGPRRSIYCGVVHEIWQQKMRHLRARGEKQRN